ncbi:hypothetical protein M758_4G260700 [Ceratodon purpureus]|nr:hypothetical protein M758_4G260700 [Ceratodon purpureus]
MSVFVYQYILLYLVQYQLAASQRLARNKWLPTQKNMLYRSRITSSRNGTTEIK